MNVRHILVPTDGSGLSQKAAAAAGDLARAMSARVSVLTVLDEQSIVPLAFGAGGAVAPAAPNRSVEEIRASMETRARTEDVAATRAALGDVPAGVETAIAWGHAASQICEFAEEHDVDLIAMGSHGRTGIKAALLGSVSHAVSNRAPCAVLIVR